jgi:hypothetical protein
MSKIHWSQCELWDSDGCGPPAGALPRLMREYRDHGCISDYWFFNPAECADDPDDDAQAWDDWNQEYRLPEDVGPRPSEIDFTGLPDFLEHP